MNQTLTVPLADGGHLNAQIDGPEGAPWVVFSNSVLTDLSIWDAQATSLSKRFHILRYDQRGHGASSIPDGPMSFDKFGADLLALLDNFNLTQCHFVGLSMGVPTGLAAFQTCPEKLLSFTVVDGVCRSAAGREAFWAERRDTARANGMDKIARDTTSRWLPGVKADAAQARCLNDMVAATPTEGFAAATHALQSYDYSGVLSRVTCPVLGIAGAQDGAMPDAIKSQFKTLPDVRFADIPKAGHVPNFQCSDAFNTTISSFFDALPQNPKETH